MKAKYREYIGRERLAGTNDSLREVNWPILQRFVHVGGEGVYSVTGFIDRTGELFVSRDATKVFQRSLQPVGVGVCFEARLPVGGFVRCCSHKLCLELGYFGLFEVEFLWFDGRWVAIDFNPRLFNQVGMDIRRGMPLPLFACLEAAGELSALREAVAQAKEDRDEEAVFTAVALRCAPLSSLKP